MNVPDAALLKTEGLDVCYGKSEIVHGVTMDVAEGEVVASGSQRSGKTVLLRAIMGSVGPRAGEICGAVPASPVFPHTGELSSVSGMCPRIDTFSPI